MIESTFNTLITSISKKVPLIKSVRHALHALGVPGTIIGADINAECIGRYFVDQFWACPPQNELSEEQLIVFCKENAVKAIIPTRDNELPFYATLQTRLAKNGISCLISSPEAIQTCLDKLKFAEYLHARGYPAISTGTELTQCPTFPCVVKERFGSGSRQIGIKLSKREAKEFAKNLQQPIYQPFIKGKEYSVDIYIDKTGFTVGGVARRRELVVGGESQITTSEHAPQLEALCAELSEKLQLYGHAVYQLFVDDKDKIYIIECNPRFGGASTLSQAIGLKSFEWFFLEALGKPISRFVRTEREKKQVRFSEDLIIDI